MSFRAITPMKLPDVVSANLDDATPPQFRWINPCELLVDEDYQRGLSERSVALIRKIKASWDWTKFKPPVVAESSEGLEVIDGQHTAIAAASIPIPAIPVMIVFAPMQSSRAHAFVSHNRDRLLVTATQVYFAMLAAGDEDALTIKQVCERAGVRVLRLPPGGGQFKPRDTMAVSCIGALINRRGAMGARVVLQAIADAHKAPVSAPAIMAVEMLLHDPEYKGQVPVDAITSAFIRLGDTAEKEARVFAAAHDTRFWKSLGIILFKEARRGRRRAA